MSQYSAECFQNAVEKGNIRAFFQPLYRTITNKMLGAEALARWFDADDRMLNMTTMLAGQLPQLIAFDEEARPGLVHLRGRMTAPVRHAARSDEALQLLGQLRMIVFFAPFRHR